MFIGAQSVRIYMSVINKIKHKIYVDKNYIAVDVVFESIYISLFRLRNGCFFCLFISNMDILILNSIHFMLRKPIFFRILHTVVLVGNLRWLQCMCISETADLR